LAEGGRQERRPRSRKEQRMQRIPLQPVDSVDVTTLVDNSFDVLLPDEGLVRRWGPSGTAGEIPVVPTGLAEGGKTFDFLRAEHGFSALIELRVNGRLRRVLFDAGVTPDGKAPAFCKSVWFVV
jgi:7,8-dihydropterin-6-yl-methyl-4-(beta-D-ribofuranosyl)aminobenzene 5'-phosphate synthase